MNKHITILGGGVVGLSTALYCVRRGMKVTLIERKTQRRDGCSFGNAGMIVPSHFVPLAAPGMVKRAYFAVKFSNMYYCAAPGMLKRA